MSSPPIAAPTYFQPKTKPGLKLSELMNTALNSFTSQLTCENVPAGATQFDCRQMNHCHYTFCKPERVPAPALLCVSKACAVDIGLSPDEFDSPLFLRVFSGNENAVDTKKIDAVNSVSGAGWTRSYATVYGCHSYGHWFGQLGDGRATILGDLVSSQERTPAESTAGALSAIQYFTKHRYPYPYTETGRFEVQLKGSGRTPYSRWGDGRAVLRSCVREFLASENMHAMRVPTTRALSVLTTGQGIRRNWYGRNNAASINKAKAEQYQRNSALAGECMDTVSSSYTSDATDDEGDIFDERFPPNRPSVEIGAVMTRITPKTFVRVAQLELFAKRNEFESCRKLADFVCEHEYPEVLREESEVGVTTAADKYIRLYKAVTDRCAFLVAEWMRVGYVQGNMNSDNLLIGGRTIDYGPFGFMEAFDPRYQPFTSDNDGHFSYAEQPVAMHVNVKVLGMFTIDYLVEVSIRQAWRAQQSTGAPPKAKLEDLVKEYKTKVHNIHEDFYFESFVRHITHVKCCKLGILSLCDKKSAESEYTATSDRAVSEANVAAIYGGLLQLMHASQCDFTVTFRMMSSIAALIIRSTQSQSGGSIPAPLSAETLHDCLRILRSTTATPDKIAPLSEIGQLSPKSEQAIRWTAWLQKYAAILLADEQQLQSSTISEVSAPRKISDNVLKRVFMQNANNPRYVLRNWMAAIAYEELEVLETARREADYERRAQFAEQEKKAKVQKVNAGDSVNSPVSTSADFQDTSCQEILDVLVDPYDAMKSGNFENEYSSRNSILEAAFGSNAGPTAVPGSTLTNRAADKYFCVTPSWARKLPGVAFMS